MHVTMRSVGELYFVVLYLVRIVPGFNVDTENAVVHTGEEGSMFGFTVAMYNDRDQRWLLVGAPEMQTSQPDIVRGGAVFKCSVNRRRGCQMMPFDLSGNDRPWNGFSNAQIENKTSQWFGASLSVSENNGFVVACAPRYVYFTKLNNKREPIGDCYIMNSDSQVQRYRPCKNGGTGHHRMGYCQSGFSSVMSNDGTTVVMGAVGSFYWQGQLFSQNLNDRYEFEETLQLQPHYNHDDSYRGYSMATGEFTGDTKADYVTGVPRGGSLKGMVTVYNAQLIELHQLIGEQLGEYYGYSVAVDDFTGDGLDDVAVGAPFYTYRDANIFEMGRVFVHYQTNEGGMIASRTVLYGEKRSKSRFGLAISALGDVNNDNFNDLAVGAPYDGEDGKGAVYIFHGSPDGIRQRFSQIIRANDIQSSLSGFGFSISGGKDMDNNLYPDILVGAYSSNKAVLLLSKPVITVTTVMKTIPSIVDIDNRSCEFNGSTSLACFTLQTCMQFSGLKVPGDIRLSRRWLLESSKNLSQRVSFSAISPSDLTMEDNIILLKGKDSCISATVYLKDDIKDKLSPIDILLEYSMVQPRRTRGRLMPILDQYSPTAVTAQANISKDCGDDKKCIPDLVIYSSSEAMYYVLGTTQDITVHIRIHNVGEDAFGALLHIDLPPGVDYQSIQNIGMQPITEDVQGNYVICDIGNPLRAGHIVDLYLHTRATASSVNGSSNLLSYVMFTNSTNPEDDYALNDNTASIHIPIEAVVNIQLRGNSNPEQVLYNSTTVSSVKQEEDVGPELIHLYEILSDGPSAIESLVTRIRWPSTINNGKYFLYLTEVPQIIQGEGHCKTKIINPANLTRGGFEDQRRTDVSQELVEQRSKRQMDYDDEQIKHVDCRVDGNQDCMLIQCHTGHMTNGESVLIQIKSRVWLESVVELQDDYLSIKAISSAVTRVTALPYDLEHGKFPVQTTHIETLVAAIDAGPGRQKVEFWVIVLAIVGGCLLLLLLVILLWRCGFFRREKVEDRDQLWSAELKKNKGQYDPVPTYDS